MSTNSLISARGLHKRFGNIHAVNDVHLDIQEGEIYGFLGPNGSGKSTTIRMLLGLIRADEGEIHLFGQPLKGQAHRLLSRVGALVEQADFYLYLSAYRNLEILAQLSRLKKAHVRIMYCLALVGLEGRAHDKVKTYSQGMRQRLGIAQTLLHDPELLLLDEPTNGLDPKGVVEMRELLLRLNREEGKTLLISSHLLQEIEKTATRVLVIHQGKTLAEGKVEDLLGQQNSRLRLKVRQREIALQVFETWKEKIEVLEQQDGNFMLSMDLEMIPALNHDLVNSGAEVLELNPSRSLEDYFLSIT